LDSNNFKNLDFLRTVAVLLVLISHIPIIKFPVNYYHVQTFGILGVFIFFVHTSCVLMFSLDRMKYKKNNFLNYKFYIQRLFRIYPLSIFVVLLVFLYNIINSPDAYFDKITLFKNIFLVQNIQESSPSALWSLPYEVAMYIFFPLIFNFIKNKNSQKKIFFLWLIFVILALIFKYFDSTYLYIVKYVPFFLSGVIAFVYFKKVKKEQKIRPIYLILYIFFSILLIPILTHFGVMQNFLGAIFTVPLGLLIAFSKDIDLFFLNKLFKLIAKYSYGIYLLHELIISIYFKHIHIENKFLTLLLLITIIFLASIAVYHMIEGPLIKYGKRISEKY
jgi:peptidoglycan/LPS O-acetylase OafA/YrhL